MEKKTWLRDNVLCSYSPEKHISKNHSTFWQIEQRWAIKFLNMQWLPQDKLDVSKQTLLRVKFHNPFQQSKDKLISMIYYMLSK